MIDELAWASGRDPLEFRVGLLKSKPRHLKILQSAARVAGWDAPPPKGHARGLAVHDSVDSIVAYCAEISADEEKEIRVHRVWAAVDCGVLVNPLGVEAQIPERDRLRPTRSGAERLTIGACALIRSGAGGA